MKILVALHQVMDLGGIINHTEQLIGGLKDLGHTVHLKELVWAANAHSQNREGDFLVGPSGIPHHQGKGWNFKRENRLPYKGAANLNSAKQIMSNYDLIIWTVPVPSKNKQNLGNNDWPELYDLPSKIKQIAFIHDGNAKGGIPHILHIADRLSGLACVHGCALNGADYVPVPRAMILNPQLRPVQGVPDWNDRAKGFVNMQTFKAWKHVHELVQAIAYMPKKEEGEYREIAGKGIEFQYMTSEDKCKENYFHVGNPGFWFNGWKFWDAAEANGMTHHDYWNVDEVQQWLQTSRVLVDPSWSRKYAANGGHWNRVVVDAMIYGAVPIATQMGMGSELFKAGEHYIAIPAGGENPQEYANIIHEAGQMDAVSAKRYREAALEVLPLFDRKIVAQQVIDLAEGSSSLIGSPNQDLTQKYKDLMFEHFGVLA